MAPQVMWWPPPCGPSAPSPGGHLRQCAQQHHDVARAGGVAHAADPPHPPGIVADPAADLDPEPGEQRPADGDVVDAVRYDHRRELREPVAFFGEELEAQLLQSLL